MPTLDVISEMKVWRKIFKAGVMKFVGPDLRCRWILAGPRMPGVFLQMNVTPTHRFGMHHHVTGNRTDHFVASSLEGDAARKIHHATALGIDRHPLVDHLPDLAA